MIDTRLPMMIQQPNVLAALDAGTTAAANQANVLRQAEGQNLFRQYGAGAMQGDRNALAQIGGFDPIMAQNMQAGQLDMQATRQGMAIDRERIQMLRDETARALASAQDQAEAMREAQEIGMVTQDAVRAFAARDEAGFARATASAFGQPLPMTEEGLAALAAFHEGAKAFMEMRPGQPAMTAEMQNLTWRAQQANLKPGTPEYKDFIATGGRTTPLVEVNTGNTPDARPIAGTPPAGFQRRWDEAAQTWRDEPIPGGAVASEEESGERTSELAIAEYNRKANIVTANLDRAINMLDEQGRMVAGFGSLLAGVPESAARDFQAVLDSIKANLGFEELQAMRDASPTGGALGQVTERELAFLQAVQGNLDAAQSPEQLMQVLQDIRARRAEFQAERERIMRGGASTSSDLDGLDPDARAAFELYGGSN